MEGEEMRGVDIVYFLSRKGRTEHPHLIRVHHLAKNGVRLRDVKRCLGELRGKEILDSFSWSCKRKYKTGYVWEDLVDDDIITPVSDDEYILKGSQISSADLKPEEKENDSKKDEAWEQSKELAEKHSSSRLRWRSSSFYWTFLSKKSKTEKQKKKKKDDDDDGVVGSCKKAEDQTKNKSMLKNLISCGDVETKDSTAKKKKRKKKSKSFMSTCSNEAEHVTSAALGTFGGSQRVFGNPPWAQQQFGTRMSFDGIESMLKNKSKSEEQKSSYGGSYKLVNGPNCSQCGKQFKPQKMQRHMKSCKGIKGLSKCAENALKGKIEVGSFSGHLRTH